MLHASGLYRYHFDLFPENKASHLKALVCVMHS